MNVGLMEAVAALFEPGMLKLLIAHMLDPGNRDLLVALDPDKAAAG